MLSPIRFLKSINTYLLRQAMMEAHRIVAFSKFSSDLIVKGLGSASADRVKVVPPGVESSWFEVERNHVDPNRILFWGRVEEEKGLPELFDALVKVVSKKPEIKLTLVGEGNRLQEYKTLVADLGLSSNVEFTGWLSNREIQKLAAQSSIGVFPSRIESFGLSVVEAMAAGLPVISARGGAVPENIKEGMTGRLVPVNDSQSLAEALLAFLEDPQSAENMAKSSKPAVQEKFSWDRAAESMLAIYESLVAKR